MPTAKRVSKENKWKAKSRFYQVEGKEYPSVTTILGCIGKPALVAWSAKVERELVKEVSATLYETIRETPQMSKIGWLTALDAMLGKTKANQKELAKAGEIGSQAHGWIEWHIKRQLLYEVPLMPPAISPKAQLAVSAWERWKDSVSFKPMYCEQPVWSHSIGYAGTMDLIAEVNGETTLLDWKTGKAVYAEAHLQNAAYRYAVREMKLATELKGMIVRLPKTETDPDFEVVPITESEESLMETFQFVLGLWKWLTKKDFVGSVDDGSGPG